MNNNTFCNMFAGGGVTGAASLPSADELALPRSKQKDKCSWTGGGPARGCQAKCSCGYWLLDAERKCMN